jgi:phosphate-selective porin OprO/OprP
MRCWLLVLSLQPVLCAPLLGTEPTDPLLELQIRLDQLEAANRQLAESLAVYQSQQAELTGLGVARPVREAELFTPGNPSQFWIQAREQTAEDDPLADARSLYQQHELKISELQKELGDLKQAASKKTFPSVRVTGFFQADAVWAAQSEENRAAIVNGAPLGDIQDGADFRRTRLAATGDVWDNVGYMVEMDFGFPGRPSFMDVSVSVRDVGALGTVTVGQFRHPFGLDAMTSVRELMFLERNLTQAFVPFRQIGAGFMHVDEEYAVTYAGSVFRYPTDFFGGNVGDDGGYGLAGRVTSLMLEGEDNLTVHCGFSYCFADPGNNLVQFRNQPELFDVAVPGSPFPVPPPGTLPFFVDTGLLPTQNFSLYGIELAGTYGPWLAQSEVVISQVDRMGPGANLIFWGAYAQLSYVLTGEIHPYNKKAGAYGRVTPQHPFQWGKCTQWGAWELAARWSMLDLTDKDIHGNQLQDGTLGLNWYLNKNTKFQFNYVQAILDSPGAVSQASLFAVRAQLDF